LTLILVFTFSYVFAQEAKVVKYEEVEKIMVNNDSETLKIFNFWATWCGPCVKELPDFEKVNAEKQVEVYLVSLDFVQDLNKVNKFLVKRGIRSNTLLLDEKDYDSYMGQVSTEWSGAIPATLFVEANGKKHFFETPFDEEELREKISEYLN